MKSSNILSFLMNPKKWWVPLLLIFVISASGLTLIGIETYNEAPPIPTFVDENQTVIIDQEDILKGQEVFHKYALMEYGSMFGDGALRGPDFTAEALHVTAQFLHEFHNKDRELDLRINIENELKKNRYNEKLNTVLLTPGLIYAYKNVENYYLNYFKIDPPQNVKQLAQFLSEEEIIALGKFFYWGGWVCVTERPDKNYSYTHNWPFDKLAGNTPTASVNLWTVFGILGFIGGLGAVLYIYGQFEELSGNTLTKSTGKFFTTTRVNEFKPSPLQRSTFKFFVAGAWLFLVQVLAGVLTVHDFVGFVNFFGFDISLALPITVTRSWHLQLSLFWITACWFAASVFILPFFSPKQPKGQVRLVNGVFYLFLLMVAGSVVGIFAGPQGLFGEYWYAVGHQGWEFVELGKVWQVLLFIIFVVWAVIIYRGVKHVMKINKPWALPNWLVYCTSCISLLFISGFIATPKTNFVIADFWRWCVIHMWVEAFFEVFTTIIVGYFMVLMGLVNKSSVVRVVFLGVLLFLGSGLLGISHNFYWNAKPVATLALGSVFSTLQVVPLILLTLEAWRFRKIPKLAIAKEQLHDKSSSFGLPDVFLFILGVNFWNFFGAGLFGFIINLPIINYYEHGTYLTVNHGHAALMGVYGNLSIAALFFCCRLLTKSERYNSRMVRLSFWSINGGLFLMVIMDLFPAGVHQLYAVFEHGYWFARSNEFIEGMAFQSLTWLRIVGGSLFLLGGVLPIVYWITTRMLNMKEDLPDLPVQKEREKILVH